MKTDYELKINRIRLTASLYFFALTLTNFTATLIYVKFKWFDLALFCVACLPFLINRKLFYLFFGSISTLISMIIAIGCLAFSINPDVTTSGTDLFMGFVLAFTSLAASLAFVYVGLQSSGKNEFRLV